MPPGPIRPLRNAPKPIIKFEVRARIIANLYVPTVNRRSKELITLVEDNAIAIQNDAVITLGHYLAGDLRHFAYNGEVYNIGPDEPPKERTRVHPSMFSRVKDFVDHFDRIFKEEQIMVESYITAVLAFSPSPGDWLTVVPDRIKEIIRETVVSDSWTELRTPGEQHAFLKKHEFGFNLIRQRLAYELLIG